MTTLYDTAVPLHVVTGYNILRHNGIEIGRRADLGTVPSLG